ncbi:MAG: type II toxin-antitoxin system RelE/ParE family toxin [Elusimicrobia bacterium]|nr:type II toxin-antitoxin system RelE/ParE family toxin [Candidatus Obscuribacterium magneticum]
MLDFIATLDDKTRAKVYRHIELLKTYGPNDEIIVVHGFLKKTQALDVRGIEMAEHRREDWLARHGC